MKIKDNPTLLKKSKIKELALNILRNIYLKIYNF